MMFLTPREALGDDIPGGWDNSGCESDEETLSAILCEWWESNKAACISDLRIEGLEIVAIDGDGQIQSSPRDRSCVPDQHHTRRRHTKAVIRRRGIRPLCRRPVSL